MSLLFAWLTRFDTVNNAKLKVEFADANNMISIYNLGLLLLLIIFLFLFANILKFCIPLLVYRNIVSTVNLGCKLDLKTIALRARNAEYNPKVRLSAGVCSQNFLTFSQFS